MRRLHRVTSGGRGRDRLSARLHCFCIVLAWFRSLLSRRNGSVQPPHLNEFAREPTRKAATLSNCSRQLSLSLPRACLHVKASVGKSRGGCHLSKNIDKRIAAEIAWARTRDRSAAPAQPAKPPSNASSAR
jgi:hypothetical protein